jgi:hypothetical protein
VGHDFLLTSLLCPRQPLNAVRYLNIGQEDGAWYIWSTESALPLKAQLKVHVGWTEP